MITTTSGGGGLVLVVVVSIKLSRMRSGTAQAEASILELVGIELILGDLERDRGRVFNVGATGLSHWRRRRC